MRKLVILGIMILFLLGCSQSETQPTQPTYSGEGCGVQEANNDYVIIPESANFFGLNLQQSRQYHYTSIESSCLNKGYDGLKGWKLITIGEDYLEIEYVCCKNALEML